MAPIAVPYNDEEFEERKHHEMQAGEKLLAEYASKLVAFGVSCGDCCERCGNLLE